MGNPQNRLIGIYLRPFVIPDAIGIRLPFRIGSKQGGPGSSPGSSRRVTRAFADRSLLSRPPAFSSNVDTMAKHAPSGYHQVEYRPQEGARRQIRSGRGGFQPFAPSWCPEKRVAPRRAASSTWRRVAP